MLNQRRTLLRVAAYRRVARAWPGWMPRMSFAPYQSAPRGDVLVCVFLRGAADVLNMVVPHGEAAYYSARAALAIPRPDDPRARADLRAIDLDGFFGLHPALAPLWPAWQARQLAFVHACGAPDESRSHFQAMELMERGVDSAAGPASGWLGRHLGSLSTGTRSPLRAIGLGERVPRALLGPVPAAALRSIADFHLGGDARAAEQLRGALAALYAGGDPLDTLGREALGLAELIEQHDPLGYRPAADARYPEGDFGMGLRQLAMLIKAEVGLEVACLDMGGWDTHVAQGGSQGWMAGLLAELGAGLAALHADLAAQADRLLVVVMSEFGRRVEENGGLGTDHGHGSMLLLLGGGVVGGRVYGRWPGLAPEQLVGPGDLAVTTDYRDVLGEIVARRLNNPRLAEVFPGYTPRFLEVVHQRAAVAGSSHSRRSSP
jgi:uncharacterized protein (DUF1501 family)